MNIDQFIKLFEYFERRQNDEILDEIFDLKSRIENLERAVTGKMEEYDILLDDLS